MKDVDFKDHPLDPPPSYSDPPPSYFDGLAAPRLPIRVKACMAPEIRLNLIWILLNDHIHPHLDLTNPLNTYIHPHRDLSTLNELSVKTLVVIPSNVLSLHPVPIAPADSDSYLNLFHDSQNRTGFINERIIGFPSTEDPLLIRLHGEFDTLEFWQEKEVLLELETQLKTHLRRDGYRVLGEVRVSVEMKRVTLRVENVMSLYETRSGKAIVIKVG